MPVEEIAVGLFPIPVPLDRLPKIRDRLADFPLCLEIAVEILPRDEEPLNEEGRFDQVAAVVVFPEERNYLSSSAVKEMGPRAVKPIRPGKEADYLQHSFGALLASNESPLHTDDERHDAEPGRPQGHEVPVAWNNLKRHACDRMRGVPVISETRFLNHCQQLFVRQGTCRGRRRVRKRRFVVVTVHGADLVKRSPAALPYEIHVATEVAFLNTDRRICRSVEGPVDVVALQINFLVEPPRQLDMFVIASGGKSGWRRGRRPVVRNVVIDFDVVNIERVRQPVVESLQNSNRLDAAWIESRVARRLDAPDERRERQSRSDPLSSRELVERTGEADRWRTLAVRVRQIDERRRIRGKLRLRVEPERQSGAGEIEAAPMFPEIETSAPFAAALRPPFEA